MFVRWTPSTIPAIYYPRHRRRELLVAFLGVNIGVLAVTIGGSLGSAIVGSLFTAGLTTQLDVDSLTPTVVSSLPTELRDAVVNAYNEALTPVFLYLVPLVVLNVLVVLFLKEDPLGARSDDTRERREDPVPM